jgi:DNA (cytosine-5)-methyltransferase 1
MRFYLGELFCGPGGLGLGATTAGFLYKGEKFHVEHKWATDYDLDSCSTYRRNIAGSNGSVIHEDVRKLDIGKLGSINSLAFGFPCNDFSIVGEQKGISGNYGPLYTYGIKALEIYKPLWFLAENVSGIRNSNEGNAFKMILNEMERVGYRLYPHLYKFENYGVPQARHRVIIIGIRNDQFVKFRIPAPLNQAPVTSKDAIENPPIPLNAYNNELTKQSKTVIERLSYINPGENAFTADLPKHLRLNVKGAKISQIYKRLDPKKPSYTVTGSGGGGTHVYHWEENRALTNRERARLQTFPDNFEFVGSKESVRKQIGMAVPVVGARFIVNSVLKSFAGIEYDFVKSNIAFDNAIQNIENANINKELCQF